MAKLNQRFDFGIFVGVRRVSNEAIIATKEGIIFERCVKRISAHLRWSDDCLEWVQWAPWRRYRGAEGDGDVPEGVTPEEREEAKRDGAGGEVIVVNTWERAPRDFWITKKDVDDHGVTRGCGGCRSMYVGLGRQAHTDAYR